MGSKGEQCNNNAGTIDIKTKSSSEPISGSCKILFSVEITVVGMSVVYRPVAQCFERSGSAHDNYT
jgi:hypothetical protein